MGRERRQSSRVDAYIPAHVDTPTFPNRFALTRNLSTTGALLTTPSRFRIGERAWIGLRLGTGDDASPIRGRIVRLEVNQDDDTGLWRYRMAVRFSAKLPSSFVERALEAGL